MQFPIITSTLIFCVAILIGLRQYNKSKERRSMIEKGLDPSLVDIYSHKNNRKIFLYAGILLLGVALGIITGIILAGLFKLHGETKELIVLSIIIFTGLSLFICHRLSMDR